MHNTKNPTQENPIIVGLDIGTTKVVAIAGRKNDSGKLEILGFGHVESAGVSHGVVMNIDQCIRSIEAAIVKCLESNKSLDIKEVYVGIAGQHIKSIQTRGDRVRVRTDEEINKDDIDMLIRDQYKTYIPAGDQIIEIIPQEYTVDNIQTNLSPIGMSGVKVGANFHIITGDRNAIRNIKRCVDKSNLNTKDLVLQPLASAAAVMNDEDLEAGVAIVDIGGGTTDLAVFYDGILKHTAVIPYAGVNITNDIRSGLGVLRAQAEQMKTQFGNALAEEASANAYIAIPGLRGMPTKEISVKNLAHIIQARMHEIMEYVLYHLRQLDLDKKLYGGIILTGGGAQLKNIIQLTEFITGMGVRLGLPNEHLDNGHDEILTSPQYATAIGLILRGYSDFESGRLRFAGDHANSVGADQYGPMYVPMSAEEAAAQTDGSDDAAEQEHADDQAVSTEQRRKRVSRVFDNLKNKFMGLFEEVDDREI